MNEKILGQLNDWGLTPEQLVTLVSDLKTLSEGAPTINFLGNGNHTVVVGGNYFAAGAGGGKVKNSGRRRQQSDDFDHQVEADDEIEADAPQEQEAPLGEASPRNNPPSSEAAPKVEVTELDRQAYTILLQNQDELGSFDLDTVTLEAIAKKGCAEDIINVKDDVDKIDEVLEKHFSDLDA